MRTKSLLSMFAAWLPMLMLSLGAVSAQAQWAPLPLSNPNLTAYPRGVVWAVARQPDGGVVFGGAFSAIDGQARGNLARLKPDGTLDPAWNTATDGLVSSLAVDQSTGAIYVGGNFTQIGGQSRNRIARLAANGSVDAGWNPSANGLVYALALHSSGALYAGGAFDQIGSQPRNRIAKLAPGGSGAADATWNPSANNEVRTLALASGAVYAGGSFTTIGGQPRKLVARLADSGTGAADASWNPSAVGAEIRALAVDSGGAVYAGGRFFEIGGLPRNNIAKLAGSGSGAADANWNASADDLVMALAVDSSGAVFAGGDFFNIGGQPRTFLAKLAGSGSGAADTSWYTGADARIFALRAGTDGVLHAGGLFETIGNTQRHMIAALPTTVIWRTLAYTAGANGTITGMSPQSVLNSGNGSAVTAEANTNYTFAQWSDGSTANPRIDTNVTANLSVTASFATRTYIVSVNATPGGTVAPTQQNVSHGATATFSVVPAAGMRAIVSGCGGSLSGTTYTTGAITASCAISVSFTNVTYTVTATAGANGTIAPASRTVSHGTYAAFTLTPAAGYRATASGCGGSLQGNVYTTAPVTADCTVTASFAPATYTVTATAGSNGTIAPASRNVGHGATTTFTLTPAANYRPIVHGCDGSLNGNTYTTGAITADCTVSAIFVSSVYIASTIAGPNGTISPPSQTVSPGATTTFSVMPAAGYQAVASGCGGSLSGTVYTTGAINTDCTVMANFVYNPDPTYTVTTILGSNGTITPRTQTVSPGATATFSVTPEANYRAEVSGCGGSLGGSTYTTAAINADCTITAVFPPIMHTVTATAGPYGAIIPASQLVRQGMTAAFDIQTYPAYHLSSATGCGGSVSGTVYTTGAITADCHIAVGFAIDTFVLTATAGVNGSITPASQTVDYNATAIFTVTPAAGYRANVSDCGGNLSGNTYSVGGVGGNCAIHATFSPDPSNLWLTIDSSRDHARYGEGLSYTISLSNLGLTEANPVSITMVLPVQLDTGIASWVCNNPGAGAQCIASGRGAVFRDNGVVLPAGSTLTWLLTAPVRPNATGGAVETLISASSSGLTVSASDRFDLVISRDGFEADGAQAQDAADEGETAIERGASGRE